MDRPAGYYITGTDTGVGKTVASVALLHVLRAQQLRVAGMKPVASGCEASADGWRNEDALALQAASDPMPPYGLVNPFALPAATAPQLAAAEAGIEVTLAPILAAYEALAATVDLVVVEGVGGWLAPLATQLEQAQLASRLGLPVLLVVGLKLGCLSHARLSERAIVGDGLRLAGWIGNQAEPGLERLEPYCELLREALDAPCLGILPHAPGADPASLGRYLRLPGRG